VPGVAANLTRRLLPESATLDAGRLIAARGLRGFVDGMVSVLLASYLSDLGFSPGQIGVLITATLLGSAALTLGVGLLGGRASPRHILRASHRSGRCWSSPSWVR
jgi:MFS family permease